MAVLPTGALAVQRALPRHGGAAAAAGVGLLAGGVAAAISAVEMYLASLRDSLWGLAPALAAPPYGIGPYYWFGPIPWPLPLLIPVGALLSALQAWLYYRLWIDPTTDVRRVLADWIARRPAALESKLVGGFLVLVVGTALLSLVSFAAMQEMHERLHVLELRAEWLAHLNTVQRAVQAERQTLAELATAPQPESLARLGALDAQVQSELDHLATYPPHPELVMRDSQRAAAVAPLHPLLTTVRTSYAAFGERLQAAAHDAIAGDRVAATALAQSPDPVQGDLDMALSELRGELGNGLTGDMLQMDADHHAELQGLMMLALLFTVLAGLLGATLARAIVRPVQAVDEQLRYMGQGDFSRHVEVANADELGWLAQEVNRVNGELAGLYAQLNDYAANLEQKVAAQVAEIEQVRQLQRYLPGQLVERVLRGEISVAAEHQRRKVTVLFADMQGFTELSDSVEAEELGDLLNEYFALMAEAVFRHRGTLLDFIGDAVMVVFGAPEEPQPAEDARRAVELGLDIQEAMAAWGRSWRQRGLGRIPAVRVGVHSGYATVGTFGTSARTEYAAIGRTTNLAARVQAAAPAGGVLITWATRALAGEDFAYASRGELQMRGLHAPVEVFEVLGPAAPVQ